MTITEAPGFQSMASTQGKDFETTVETFLKIGGWSIVQSHATVAGVEIDIIADDPQGRRWWIECKGSWRGNTPGSKRGDTVKKAVGVAWYLSTLDDRLPYMLVTSHLPTPGTVGDRLLTAALTAGLFQRISTLSSLQEEPTT
jgi:hypothetical protein